jgi:hypothetical protein
MITVTFSPVDQDGKPPFNQTRIKKDNSTIMKDIIKAPSTSNKNELTTKGIINNDINKVEDPIDISGN